MDDIAKGKRFFGRFVGQTDESGSGIAAPGTPHQLPAPAE
jgi:hypothetical protein